MTPLTGAVGLASALAFSSPAAAASTPSAPLTPMTGSPIALADGFRSSAYDANAHVQDWRRCGFYGCRRGWRGRRWHRGHGIGVGDVLAGVVIVGGIAAIASAASNNRRRDREVVVVEREVRDDDRRAETRSNPRSTGSTGLDSAVSQCLRAIERDVRVDSVDGASRISSGWVVTGSIFDGSGFTCEIGNNGRISDIEYGRFDARPIGSAPESGRAGQRAQGQWSDDRYASARASMDSAATDDRATTTTYSTAERFADARSYQEERPAEPLVPLTSDRMPAYPGGPIPGEDTSE